ncbi:MAG: amidohydrolase family protein, partial [Sphaerochaetaceae bacterium]
MQTVLRHAYILTQDGKQTIYTDGALVIENETIAYVGEDSRIPSRYASFPTLDCSDCLLMPSLINCHTHTGMVAFRSLGDDIADRLRRFLLPLERACMTPHLAKASAALAIAEMQLSGIGCAVDMYYFEKELAKLATSMQFRLYGGETIIENSPNCTTVDEALAYAKAIPNTKYYQRI